MFEAAGTRRTATFNLDARAKGKQSFAQKILIDVEVAIMAAETMIRDQEERIVRPQHGQNLPKSVIEHLVILVGTRVEGHSFFPQLVL